MKKYFLAIFMLSIVSCFPAADINDYVPYFRDDERPLQAGEFSVTFLGVSTLLFDDGESKFMIDGFLSRPSASDVVFKKLASNPELIEDLVNRYSLGDIKAIFTTHTHYDHALDAAYLAKLTGAELNGSSSALNLGRGAGLGEGKLKEFQPGDPIRIGEFTITVLQGKHSPSKILNADIGETIDEPLIQPARFTKYKEGGSYDFLIERRGRAAYVKPSPNYIPGAMDDLKADVLFLGTGSVGTAGEEFLSKFYEETVKALEPSILVPIHWDNFLKQDIENLKMMPYYMDRGGTTFDYLIKRSTADSIRFEVLLGGSKINLKPFN